MAEERGGSEERGGERERERERYRQSRFKKTNDVHPISLKGGFADSTKPSGEDFATFFEPVD